MKYSRIPPHSRAQFLHPVILNTYRKVSPFAISSTVNAFYLSTIYPFIHIFQNEWNQVWKEIKVNSINIIIIVVINIWAGWWWWCWSSANKMADCGHPVRESWSLRRLLNSNIFTNSLFQSRKWRKINSILSNLWHLMTFLRAIFTTSRFIRAKIAHFQETFQDEINSLLNNLLTNLLTNNSFITGNQV